MIIYFCRLAAELCVMAKLALPLNQPLSQPLNKSSFTSSNNILILIINLISPINCPRTRRRRVVMEDDCAEVSAPRTYTLQEQQRETCKLILIYEKRNTKI